MRYYLDCEFNGYGGQLLTMAIVNQANESVYLIDQEAIQTLSSEDRLDPWFVDNVLPFINSQPIAPVYASVADWDKTVGEFIYAHEGETSQVFADWPLDISYLCRALLDTPSTMVKSTFQTHFTLLRCNAYPTSLEGAVRHNAWWDAMALRQWLIDNEANG